MAAFEDLGAGARAPGLGNAFTALADDANALYYNPAGLTQLERPQFSASYSKLHTGFDDGSNLGLSQLTYAHPLSNGRGTLGGAWQRFNLSDLYEENSLYLSYGRALLAREPGDKLMLGVNLKYLQHSFSRLPEASNSCSGLNCNQGPDPVLQGATGKGAMDADLGLIYRFPRRFQLGLAAQHIMRPDVGFAGQDRLPLNIRGGLAYKTLWMNLAGELRLDPAPDGSRDKNVIVAAERYFPTLEYGQFGMRGALGFGSRQWRQLTMGVSYRINKIQFDYALLMPIGGLKTDGTHRMAMTFHFGAPAAEDEISREFLEKARLLREGRLASATGQPEYGYEFQETLRPHDLDDPRLAEVRQLIYEGQLRKAQERLAAVMKQFPNEPSLERLNHRLELAAYFYPDIPLPVERWEAVLSSAVVGFLRGRDRLAALHGSYALDLQPSDQRLQNFLGKMESATKQMLDRLPPDHPRSFIDELLHRVEAAHTRRDYARVEYLLRDIIELEPSNVVALERTGSVYFILGRYNDAVAVWERALPLESNPEELNSLREYIAQAKAKTAGAGGTLPGGVAAPPPPAGAPLGEAPKLKPAAGDPRDIAPLYQKGVEHYARGEYLQATAMFMRILQIDPNNQQAQKALERISRRPAAP